MWRRLRICWWRISDDVSHQKSAICIDKRRLTSENFSSCYQYQLSICTIFSDLQFKFNHRPFNMNISLSLREEISLSLLIFFIAIMTIPVILRSSSSTAVTARSKDSAVERSLRNELLMNSISILEINNRIARYSSKIELSTIIYSPLKNITDLLKVEIKDVERRRTKLSSNRKATRKTWKKFTYIRNSTLKSNSLRLPLKVDWWVGVNIYFQLNTKRQKPTTQDNPVESWKIQHILSSTLSGHCRRDEMDVVSRVKEQKCGDCFAVAVIETIESMYAIKHRKLMNLSVEQMDECNNLAMGCNGGNPTALLHWLVTANDGRVMTQEKFLEINKSCTNANEVDDSSDAAAVAKVEDYSHNK